MSDLRYQRGGDCLFIKVMGGMILEFLTALTRPHAVCSWLQKGGPGRSKVIYLHELSTLPDTGPKPASLEEVLDRDL